MDWGEGHYYEGSWVADERCGKGVFSWPDHEIYKGERLLQSRVRVSAGFGDWGITRRVGVSACLLARHVRVRAGQG
eukprot:2677612-Rhodomonas_salina.1